MPDIMVDIPTVLLDQLAFIEVNYQYELEVAKAKGKPPQCLLLLGDELPEKMIALTKCLNIPLSLKSVDESCVNFNYDTNQINKRIELIKCTNPSLKPHGVMILNETLYDYSTMLKKLRVQQDDLQYLFTYSPHADRDKSLQLCCYSIELTSDRLTFNKFPYEFRNSKNNVDMGFLKLRHDAPEDELTAEEEFTIKLASKVNQVIEYLQNSSSIDPKIMRNISLLVSRLKRPSTDDIEQGIMNKESEISAFKIACEQWEMAACLLRSKSSD